MNCQKSCHNRKKCLFFLPSIVLLLVWLFFFVDINRRFPKPEETVVHVGDSFLYHGFEVEIPQNGEVLSFDEVVGKYQLDGKISKGDMINIKNSWEEYYCLDLLIKNQTEESMKLPVDYTPQVWALEMDQRHVNGNSHYLFYAANEHLLDTMEAGEEREIHLIYGVAHKEWLQKSVRIYYSFYPTKNYIEQDILSVLSEKEVEEEKGGMVYKGQKGVEL